ncbi:SPOR domain-containing protein [Vibrio vulnificus]|uniref:SPOR domain-containing protein n=1 Tax=Vibrio vulnificus TaxID=672 RepID=UPI001A2C864B|nr:SPOR domain-containing protein [Vibrio vulnificus]MDS1872079.1 SPOR domain-containing protein [Vibrio vulnificus]HAS6020750.1 SPOR domain-containing protein [Vibrio vulnificus]
MEQSKSAPLPIFKPQRLWLVAALCTFGLATPAVAEGFLCEATQVSSNELPMLDKACPIGDGIWGTKVPKSGKNDYFWIQCGILNQPMSLAGAKPLYKQITTDVWMKPENKSYRCLIGPYQSFAQASKDLKQVKTLGDYREAFIRIVKPHSAVIPETVNKEVKAVTKPTATKSPKASVAASKPMPAPAQATLAKTPVKRSNDDSSSIDIRKSAELKGRTYAIPYLMDDKHQFYMEHNQAWNRLDYASAEVVCSDLHMRLLTEEEFFTLLDSKVMEKQQWPMQLPYWGRGNKGFFTDGRITQVKGSSLLNVLCVK